MDGEQSSLVAPAEGMDETGRYLQTKDAEQMGYDCLVWSNMRIALSSQ